MTVVWLTRSKACFKSKNTRATDVFRIFRFLKKSRKLIRQCVIEELFMLGAGWEYIHLAMKSSQRRQEMGVTEMGLRTLSD